jgi:hypothetical protein
VHCSTMQLATGTVIGGKIIIDGDPRPDGTGAATLAREMDETLDVPRELEARDRDDSMTSNGGCGRQDRPNQRIDLSIAELLAGGVLARAVGRFQLCLDRCPGELG